MTHMNMELELRTLSLKYFGSVLKPIVLDAFLTELNNMITTPKVCSVCDEVLYWDSRASAYTDSDGLTSSNGVSSDGHDHEIDGVEYKFRRYLA